VLALEDEGDAQPAGAARGGEAPAANRALDALAEVAEAGAARGRGGDGPRAADGEIDVDAEGRRLPRGARRGLVAALHHGALAVHHRSDLLARQLRTAALVVLREHVVAAAGRDRRGAGAVILELPQARLFGGAQLRAVRGRPLGGRRAL